MRTLTPLALTALAISLAGLGRAGAEGFHCGATAVQLAAWMTSTTAEAKEDGDFTTIPDTGLLVRTSRRGDLLVHFCAQLDNLGGGRTMVRATVDGAVAEPALEPAAILSWDQQVPQVRCMDWVVASVPKGDHRIEIQWSNDLGGASRVSYRTLIVHAPAAANRVTFEPGVAVE